MTAKDTETPLSRLLSEVETITTRFNGTTYGAADSVDGKEINDMPSERIKDLFRILVTVATKIQSCDTAPNGPNDPDSEAKKKDTNAQDFQHLAFPMELVTLGISHLLVATEKFPGTNWCIRTMPRHTCSRPASTSTYSRGSRPKLKESIVYDPRK
jgi:hypothetical protein